MKRFGAKKGNMQPMKDIQIFMARLHLVMVIVKAALKGYPIGEFRKSSAIENANEIHKLLDVVDIRFLEISPSSNLFRQRVKLLCIMATAIVSESYPLGKYRQQAVIENLNSITHTAFSKEKNEPEEIQLFHDILKVA